MKNTKTKSEMEKVSEYYRKHNSLPDYYCFSMKTSKDSSTTTFDIDNIKENLRFIDEESLDRLSIKVSVETLEGEVIGEVAEIELVLVPANLHDDDIISIADEDGDSFDCISSFLYSENYKKIGNECLKDEWEDLNFLNEYIAELHTFYIDPYFRQTNVAGNILDNLPNIVAHMFGKFCSSIIVYTNPFAVQDHLSDKTSRKYDGKNKKLIDKMNDFIERHGYKTYREDRNYHYWTAYKEN